MCIHYYRQPPSSVLKEVYVCGWGVCVDGCLCVCAGTFSSVFLARLKHHPDIKELFALKHIIPTSHPNRILGELTCLKLIGYVCCFVCVHVSCALWSVLFCVRACVTCIVVCVRACVTCIVAVSYTHLTLPTSVYV